jgi:hypothetical protein
VADTEKPLFPDAQPEDDQTEPALIDEAQPDEAAQSNEFEDAAQPIEVAAGGPPQSGQVELEEQDVAQPFLAADVTQPVEVAANETAPSEKIERQEQAERQEAPEPPRLSRAERETYERARRRFAACGRCGYFLGDLQLYLGEDTLQSEILAARDGWLRVEGDETFRRLLSNAYGVQLDVGYDYFDGSCPECRRRFVFAEQEEGPTRLKLLV